MIRIRRDQGAVVHVAFLTDGMTSGAGEELVGVRRNEAESAMALLGVDGSQVTFLGFPDGALRPQAASATHDVLGLLPRGRTERGVRDGTDRASRGSRGGRRDRPRRHRAVGSPGRRERVSDLELVPVAMGAASADPRRSNACAFLRLMRSNARSCGPLRLLREFAYVLDVDGVAQHKQAAIEQYSSQLDPPAGEPSLRDLGGGEFLEIFRSGREHFRRTVFD